MPASMPYLLLVFVHLLAACMALGAIVATDLRLLSKLAQDRVRIAPPNEFVTRLVLVALLVLWVTGAVIVGHGLLGRADYLANPKLQVKILFVALLTVNAFVLHRVTFPRLARGRSVARWRASEWFAIAVPVAVSNFLWLFAAFLGIARPWNYSTPLGDIFAIAACVYLVVQLGVVAILRLAGGAVDDRIKPLADIVRRSLASLGSLGVMRGGAGDGEVRRHPSSRRHRPVESERPALRLVIDQEPAQAARPRARQR
ncbi:MAG: hypothetical protein ABIZ18_00230 [Caldimonas sp.]